MLLIRVGRRRINLEYLIEDEEGDGTPESSHIPMGGVLVTLQRGKEFVLVGPEADSYRRQVEPYVLGDPGDTLFASVAHHVPSSRQPAGEGGGVAPGTGEADVGKAGAGKRSKRG